MVHFSQPSRTPNYRSRQARRRVFVMVGMFFLIVFLMSEARKPKYYRWLWVISASRPVAEEPVDTRLARRQTSDIPGVIVAAADPPVGNVRPAVEVFKGVQPELLAKVRDDTVLRGGTEHDAFFHLLEILNNESLESLEQAATPVTFVQLFKQSDDYRGELVSVQGSIRRAFKLQAPQNEYGIKDYYQTWFWPADKDFPMVVYFLDLPAGFPTGMTLHEDVSIVGFYFKRWAYKAADDIRTAPLLLGKIPTWHKAVPWTERRNDVPTWQLAVCGGALALILGGIVWYVRHSPTAADEVVARQQQSGASHLGEMADDEVLPQVRDALAQLEQEPVAPQGFHFGEDEEDADAKPDESEPPR